MDALVAVIVYTLIRLVIPFGLVLVIGTLLQRRSALDLR